MLNITNYQGNSKLQLDITSNLLEWLLSKRQVIASTGKDVEKWEPLYTLIGNISWYSHNGKHCRSSPPNYNRTTMWSAIPQVGIYLKEMKSWPWRGVCIPMFTVALFAVAKTWKPPKYPSANEWIKKCILYTHSWHTLSHTLWTITRS